MRQFSLFLILCMLMPVIYFSSCAEDENEDDNERPVVEYAHINVNDTLYVRDKDYSKEEIILKLNDSLNIHHEIDTMTIGKWMVINAAFRDDKGLSSFKVETRLRYKARPGGNDEELDTIFFKLGRNIFGKDTIKVARNRLMQIPDSITRMYDRVPIKMDLIPNDYDVKVTCIDVSGKRDSITFPIRVIHRKTIYDARLGKLPPDPEEE